MLVAKVVSAAVVPGGPGAVLPGESVAGVPTVTLVVEVPEAGSPFLVVVVASTTKFVVILVIRAGTVSMMVVDDLVTVARVVRVKTDWDTQPTLPWF